jgi:hypothetical protein
MQTLGKDEAFPFRYYRMNGARFAEKAVRLAGSV